MPELYSNSRYPQENTKPPSAKRESTEYSQVMRDFKSTHNPLASFMVRPQIVRMAIQEADERILIVLRRHFITNIGLILLLIGMMLAPLLFSLLPIFSIMPPRFVVATHLLWYLLTLGIGLNGFLSWYYNVYVITDERIIDVDFLNLVYKNVASAKIDNIEDVSIQTTGAIRNMLNFGTILIQTAAEKNQFEFEDVPQPQQVAKLLNELMLEEEQEQLEGRAK